MRHLLAAVLRLLPAVMALGLPFVTPDARPRWSAAGAGWLQADPDAYRGRALSLVVHCPPGCTLAAGLPVSTMQLAASRQSTADRLMRVQGWLDDRGTLSVVAVDREYEDRLLAYRVNTVIGVFVATALLRASIRLRGDLRLELRPWIR